MNVPDQNDSRDERLSIILSDLDSNGLTEEERLSVATRRLEAERAATPEGSAVLDLAQSADRATSPEQPAEHDGGRNELWLVLACALGAALAYKMTNFFGLGLDKPGEEFYTINIMFLVLPFLAIYFAVRNRLPLKPLAAIAGIFAVTATAVNLFPYAQNASTEFLTGLHLPILLWLVTGVAYVAGEWRSNERRMDYTKFTGEWIINFGLLSAGVGLLSAITGGIFEAIGIDASTFMFEWLLPSGVMGSVVVAGWLVAKRRGLSAGIAPWLAKVFTPLFAAMVVAVLGAIAVTFTGPGLDREVLIIFDLLLVVVTALLLYGIAARDPKANPGAFDWIQLVLVVGALALNVYALASMGGRLTEMGLTPNRVAAFGLNLILLVNLGWSAVLQLGFLRGQRPFADIAAWQMAYLPVYAGWAAVVALVLPLVFHFA